MSDEIKNKDSAEFKVEPINEDLRQITNPKDLQGFFSITSVVPTTPPSNFLNQIKIYVNGATYRLYWYDYSNGVWHYVTATN